jgi:E3 ubiquitin-protein ligase ZSWIM2
VPTSVPIVWQKSLIDSEIEMLLRGDYRERTESATTVGQRQPMAFLRRREAQQQQQQKEQEQKNQTEQLIERHELVNGEVCAICQEDMDDKQPLTYCRKGCGNNFHIECSKLNIPAFYYVLPHL